MGRPLLSTASTKTQAARKMITPITASKEWKENFRRSCLHRARQRCRLLDYKDADSPAMKHTANYDDIRQIVEEELRERTVLIRAHSCFADGQTESNHQNYGDYVRAENSSMAIDPTVFDEDQYAVENGKVPEAQHYISEEDLYELMNELEQEMEREQAFLVDDMLQKAENERRYLAEQVLDYEQWEEIMHPQSNDVVPCPVCHEENLVLADNGQTILCPNTMNGLCSLTISCCTTTANNNELTTLHNLQARLRQAYEAHSLRCHHFLSFRMQDGQLWAYCSACAGSARVV